MNSLQKGIMRAITGSRGEPNLDDLLDRSDRLMESCAPEPVGSAPESKPRHGFAGDIPLGKMRPSQVFRYLPAGFAETSSFMASMRQLRRRGRLWRGTRPVCASRPIAELQATLEAEMLRLGATSWGIAGLPPWAVFAGKTAPFPQAIVFAGSMDATAIAKAPDFEILREVARAYGAVGRMANRLASALCARGIPALPGHPLGGVVDYAALGQLAGMGWVGRSGLLISPSDGSCQRIGLVFVDLPRFEHRPRVDHSWIGEFCDSCGACARRCPVGAIPKAPRVTAASQDDHEGGKGGDGNFDPRSARVRGADGDLCLPYFHAHWGCSLCIAACPFTSQGHDRVKQGFLRARDQAHGE